MMIKLTLGLYLALLHINYTFGICCPWKVTSDVKCACDDGGLVHPWECCSTGACNVFCCNCGGPCRSNQTDHLHFSPDQESFNTYLHFSALDANQDSKIDLTEAFNHFQMTEAGLATHSLRKALSPVWFSRMDTDRNGHISPTEFDSGLSQEILNKFNSMVYTLHN